MRDLLAELEHRYALVIVDTPPVGVVSDAVPLMRCVSGVVVVVRIGQSKRGSVRHLAEQLHNLTITPLGVVLNGGRDELAPYSYGYGYAAHGVGHTESREQSGSAARRLRRKQADYEPTRPVPSQSVEQRPQS